MTNTEKALEFFKENPGHLKTATGYLAERLGVTWNDIRDARVILRGTEISSNTDIEKTVEKKGHKTEYERFLAQQGINKEDVLTVYVKEKADGVRFTVLLKKNAEESFDVKQATIEHLKEYTDIVPAIPLISPKGDEKVAVINLFDAHLDKISFLSETDEQNTLESNISRFEGAFDEILSMVAGTNPELIIFPISGDLFQSNDANLTTKKGTDQKHQQHPDYKDAYKQSLHLIRRCIDKAKQFAPIRVLSLQGNHDEDKMFYFATALEIAYEKDANVDVVDCSRKQRVYERYGRWLFGFAHGDKEKSKVKDLPNLMATDKDSRRHWSEIEQAVFFLGDIHHEREYDLLRTQDFRGVKVKFLRGVTGTDKWHTDHGWTGVPKTAYADVYDKNSGRVAYFALDV